MIGSLCLAVLGVAGLVLAGVFWGTLYESPAEYEAKVAKASEDCDCTLMWAYSGPALNFLAILASLALLGAGSIGLKGGRP